MNNSNPRQLSLLDTVRERGAMTVEQLAELLGVTLQTVRRDVQRLADAGLLLRFHGGVRAPASTTENIAHPQRETLNAAGKARIARAVAERVPNDCSLILNIGTFMNVSFEKDLLLQNPLTYETGDVISTYLYRIFTSSPSLLAYATAIGLFEAVIGLVLIIGANLVARLTVGTSLW